MYAGPLRLYTIQPQVTNFVVRGIYVSRNVSSCIDRVVNGQPVTVANAYLNIVTPRLIAFIVSIAGKTLEQERAQEAAEKAKKARQARQWKGK